MKLELTVRIHAPLIGVLKDNLTLIHYKQRYDLPDGKEVSETCKLISEIKPEYIVIGTSYKHTGFKLTTDPIKDISEMKTHIEQFRRRISDIGHQYVKDLRGSMLPFEEVLNRKFHDSNGKDLISLGVTFYK